MPSRFTRTREDFTCSNCGVQVHGDGYTNHCPECLWSRHVDVNPGDRAAECGGPMAPIAAVSERDGVVIVQRCTACGHVRRNRSAANDRRSAVLGLFGNPIAEPAPIRPRRPRRPHRA